MICANMITEVNVCVSLCKIKIKTRIGRTLQGLKEMREEL